MKTELVKIVFENGEFHVKTYEGHKTVVSYYTREKAILHVALSSKYQLLTSP